MPRIISTGVAVAVASLLLITSLRAQTPDAPPAVSQQEEIAALQEKSRASYEAEKWVAFYVANSKLSKLRPYEPEYMINIVRACALLGRKTTAYHFMLKMQQQGMTYDFNSTEDTVLIRDTEAYEYINDLLITAGGTAGAGIPVFTLPGNPGDFKAIAWDGSRDKTLLGTTKEGKVFAVSNNGESKELLEAGKKNGLWSISGLAVDVERNRLWISSAATPAFKGFSPEDENKSALFEFDLKTLESLGRYDAPDDGLMHELGNLAVTEDGHVYVINRAAPIVYRKSPEGDQLDAFFGSMELQAMRDIAVTPDNSRVFVSDAEVGLMVIDPVAEQAALLGGPETLNLGGIEGIEYDDGQLFLVQGGFNPQRLVRLELDASGAVAQSVSPMAIALDDFDRPGFAALQGDNIFYIANSAASDAAAVVIMSTPLDAGVQVAPPDMMDFEKAIKARKKQAEE